MLIGNPHFPWNGPNRLWQMHITGPGGYNVMGVGLSGSPIPSLGFNRDVAWTHTVTAARHFTLHALTLDPTDPTRYLVDGNSVPMEPRTVSVPLPDGAPAVTRTLYTTRFGPVVIAPQSGLNWTASAAFAVQDANRGGSLWPCAARRHYRSAECAAGEDRRAPDWQGSQDRRVAAGTTVSRCPRACCRSRSGGGPA